LSGKEALRICRRLLKNGAFVPTPHFKGRMARRNILIRDIFRVINKGEIKDQPEWDMEHQNYKFSVSGNDIEGNELEVVVGLFIEEEMMSFVTIF
jgi:hypothetical protein